MVIDSELLDKVSEQAKHSPRLRMNYNFHQSLDEKVGQGGQVSVSRWHEDASRTA